MKVIFTRFLQPLEGSRPIYRGGGEVGVVSHPRPPPPPKAEKQPRLVPPSDYQ